MIGIDIVMTAKNWVGTPYSNNSKVKGEGVDCVQLIIGVLQELNYPVENQQDYAFSQDNFQRLINQLDAHCAAVDRKEIKPGDFLIFRNQQIVNGQSMNNHVGIASFNNQFIHAYGIKSINKVVEEELSRYWRVFLHSCYRLKEVENG